MWLLIILGYISDDLGRCELNFLLISSLVQSQCFVVTGVLSSKVLFNSLK